MLTRFYLHFEGHDHLLGEEDLYNWDQVMCSYKRNDYAGVVRSFTSQFQFVNHARDLLMDLYAKYRHNAKVSVSVWAINDRWEYERRFECPLDFSSVSWDSHVFKINAVDKSIAALIRANNSTKYEFIVDEDIERDDTFLFKRLPIREGLTFTISGGNSQEDGSLLVGPAVNNRIICGVTNADEVYVGGAMLWNNDQSTEVGSYLIRAEKDVELTIEAHFEVDRCQSHYEKTEAAVNNRFMQAFFQRIKEDGTTENLSIGGLPFFAIGQNTMFNCGDFNSEAALRNMYPQSAIINHQDKYYSTVQGIVWLVKNNGPISSTDWECQNVTLDKFRRLEIKSKGTVSLEKGDKIAFVAEGTAAHVYGSSMNFSWATKGEPCIVPAFRPETVAENLLRKICGGKVNPLVTISSYDSRVSKTLILAAECIRGLQPAKLYSSFDEFCDWMEAVFGYVYYIGEESDSTFKAHRLALGYMMDANYPITARPWTFPTPAVEYIAYFRCYGKFLAYDGKEWHDTFTGDDAYNDPDTGYARTDTVFTLKVSVIGGSTQKPYYFVIGEEGIIDFNPVEYHGDVEHLQSTFQQIHFVHRSELFGKDTGCRKLDNCRGLTYQVESSVIYSTVTAGYEKKDYENINGRDEFNFSNTYTTGCTVTDNELSLVSKYRADCYGIEFAAQKRGAKTTDSTSDKDVFFVLCSSDGKGMMVADRTNGIENAMSEDVFNGAFSPMACIRANAGYIGLQADEMKLAFASSTGNSEIVIDGESMSADIIIDAPLASSGVIEFTTDAVDDVADVDELVEVVDEGITYRGFLKDVDIKYTRTEAAKYRLIVKEMVL